MAEVVQKTIFQIKRGTSSAWQKVNPVLRPGEPGFELDTNRLKIGNGKTAYNDLEYIEGATDLLNFPSKQDFPAVGNAEYIYRAIQEKQLYQWNSVNSSYELLNSGGSNLEEITIIHGGNAHGKNA